MAASVTGRVQVNPGHYTPSHYLTPQRMASIGWQLRLMTDSFPRGSVLEVGRGSGLGRHLLEQEGFSVTSIDIDPALRPEIIAPISAIPIGNNAFDCFVCCQVLEHMPWQIAKDGLRELHRTCRLGGVLSVPTVSRLIALSVFGPRRDGFRVLGRLPSWGARRRNSDEHSWELGAGLSLQEFREALKSTGFDVVCQLRSVTWFYHQFFVVKPTQ
jgi:SAM-dependent methyltransferase